MDIGPSFRGFWNIFRGFWNMIVSLCFSYPLKVSWYKSLSNGVAWFGICHWWRPKKSRFHPYLLCPDSSLNLLIYEVCPSDWCCPKTVHDSFGGSKIPSDSAEELHGSDDVDAPSIPFAFGQDGVKILQNMARVLHPAIQFSNSAPDVLIEIVFKVCWRSIIQNFCRAILYLWKDVRCCWNKRTIIYCRCTVKYHFSIMPEGAPNKRIQVCW